MTSLLNWRGDDLKTITSKNTRWYQKVGAAAMIASNFVPGLNVVGKVAKAARATYKAVKTVRATYTVAKAVVKTSSKRVAGRALHATKTVGVKSYRNTKKLAGTVKAKAQQRFTRKSTAKTSSSSSVSQRNAKTETRYVKNKRKTESTTQGADEIAATSELGAKGTGNAGTWSSEKGIYSVAHEVNLPKDMYPNVSSPRHFQNASEQLCNVFQKDSKFAQQMKGLYPEINKRYNLEREEHFHVMHLQEM